ncbi:hypothetical protein Scep_018114 [Stephania cephalantha]|uniref:AMP-dependent synthetase/ligase domain-containing protein n=1 Tax=Stephania cephalantha TaxID=152367 RepID=A0AAP0IQU9_9MAGN
MMADPNEAKRYGSVGRLNPNVEAKIVDPATGLALPPGHGGEMWFRSPGVMKGYVGDERATADAFDLDGWLKTGDLCVIDNEGFVYVVDRIKELIKYKAYQVPPAELEHLLLSHPDIVDSAVAPYKKLRRVAFIGSIPKTPSGKTLRRELVDFAFSAHSSKLKESRFFRDETGMKLSVSYNRNVPKTLGYVPPRASNEPR